MSRKRRISKTRDRKPRIIHIPDDVVFKWEENTPVKSGWWDYSEETKPDISAVETKKPLRDNCHLLITTVDAINFSLISEREKQELQECFLQLWDILESFQDDKQVLLDLKHLVDKKIFGQRGLFFLDGLAKGINYIKNFYYHPTDDNKDDESLVNFHLVDKLFSSDAHVSKDVAKIAEERLNSVIGHVRLISQRIALTRSRQAAHVEICQSYSSLIERVKVSESEINANLRLLFSSSYQIGARNIVVKCKKNYQSAVAQRDAYLKKSEAALCAIEKAQSISDVVNILNDFTIYQEQIQKTVEPMIILADTNAILDRVQCLYTHNRRFFQEKLNEKFLVYKDCISFLKQLKQHHLIQCLHQHEKKFEVMNQQPLVELGKYDNLKKELDELFEEYVALVYKELNKRLNALESKNILLRQQYQPLPEKHWIKRYFSKEINLQISILSCWIRDSRPHLIDKNVFEMIALFTKRVEFVEKNMVVYEKAQSEATLYLEALKNRQNTTAYVVSESILQKVKSEFDTIMSAYACRFKQRAKDIDAPIDVADLFKIDPRLYCFKRFYEAVVQHRYVYINLEVSLEQNLKQQEDRYRDDFFRGLWQSAETYLNDEYALKALTEEQRAGFKIWVKNHVVKPLQKIGCGLKERLFTLFNPSLPPPPSACGKNLAVLLAEIQSSLSQPSESSEPTATSFQKT